MHGTATDFVRAAQKHTRRARASHALRRDAPAPVAVAPITAGYNGALPQFAPGAVLPLIERSPSGVDVDLAYLMAEAGFTAKLPARGCSPADWVGRAIESLVAECVPEVTFCPIYVGLFPPYEGQGMPIVGLELPQDGDMVLSLHTGLAALRNGKAAAAACSIINSSYFLMGPDRFFTELEHYYWQGNDSEVEIAQEYKEQGETYDGITRAQWDAVYPAWSFGWKAGRHRGGLTDLQKIADGRSRGAAFARALLSLRASDRAARRLNPRDFGVDIGEAMGYDTWMSWGVPLVWSRKENLTAMVLDAMYDNAMQASSDMSVAAFQLPEVSAGVDRMRAFRRVLEAALREFSAASAVCLALRFLEKEDA